MQMNCHVHPDFRYYSEPASCPLITAKLPYWMFEGQDIGALSSNLNVLVKYHWVNMLAHNIPES
jgi:hypothetical protein